MNLGDIVYRVRRAIEGVVAPQGLDTLLDITDEDIRLWANSGQLDIMRSTENIKATATIPSVLGQESYTLPVGLLTLERVTFDGKQLFKSTVQEIDDIDPSKDATETTGTPSRYAVWGTDLLLYARPGRVADIDLLYTKLPTELVLASDVPEIPVQYHDNIVDYCIIKARETANDLIGAQVKRQDYTFALGEARHQSQMPETDSYPSIRTLPGDQGDWGY